LTIPQHRFHQSTVNGEPILRSTDGQWLRATADQKWMFKLTPCRVARWHIFKPKIPIWVHFGGSSKGRCWHILLPFGLFTAICIFCGHWVYFMVIWYVFSWFSMLRSILFRPYDVVWHIFV
jgi:hypothetical protein